MSFSVFCTYCWRPLLAKGMSSRGSKYFCEYHFAYGETKKNNIRDKRKIFNALDKDSDEWSIAYENYRKKKLSRDSFFEITSKSLTSLWKSPEEAAKRVKLNNYSLSSTTRSILEVVSNSFPMSYSRIEKISKKNFTSNVELLALINVEFNEGLRQYCTSGDYATLELGGESTRWVKFVLQVIARHESYLYAQERGKITGTRITDVNKDKLCKSILKILKSNEKKGIKDNYRTMAVELGFTEAWIGRLANRIKKQSLSK